MRKNKNDVQISGYLYSIEKLRKRESKMKKPFFTGEISVALDEEGLNIIPVRIRYVGEYWSNKENARKNYSFDVLSKIYDNNLTWNKVGKEQASKVKIAGNLLSNDFYSQDGELVEAQAVFLNSISFIQFLPEEVNDRNKFNVDMYINKMSLVEANEEKGTDESLKLKGYVFGYQNVIYPCSLTVRNPRGIDFFQQFQISDKEPYYTNVWGHFNTIVVQKDVVNEGAWGETYVSSTRSESHIWEVTGIPKMAYEFGDETVLTAQDMEKLAQDRSVALAEEKTRWQNRNTATQAQPAASTQGFSQMATNTIATPVSGTFNF